MKKTTSALILLLAAACSPVPVIYSDRGGNPPFDRAEYRYPGDGFACEREPGVFRICFDRQGDLYPDPRQTLVDTDRMLAGKPLLRSALAGYDGDRIAEGFATRLRSLLKDRPLVILIHGIDNAYPHARRSYELARNRIRKFAPGARFVFLEVYWDGGRGAPESVWNIAQPASRWVGLGLRRILSRLEPGTRVRILTHSRGAMVAASALGNVAAHPSALDRREFGFAQRSLPAPKNLSVRVAMLVPAIGGKPIGVFSPERLLLGVNEDDPAVGKEVLPSWMFGTTELGCNLSLARSVAGAENVLDLSGSDVHDFKDYLMRRAFGTRVIPALFGIDPSSLSTTLSR